MRPTKPLLVLLLLTLALFAPSLGNGFSMDDAPLAQSVDQDGKPDRVVAEFHGPWWFLGQRYWAFTGNDTSVLYRPVTVASYAYTYQLLGRWLPESAEAFPHHLLNVLLHALGVWLLWWMLRDLGVDERGALIGAALFACHAIHTEVVAGIVGRAELLSFALGLAGILAFVRRRVVLAGLFLFFAFGSKESALAWAPFLPCYLLARSWLGQPAALPWKRIVLVVGVPLLVFLGLRGWVISDVPGAGTFSWDQNPLAHVDTLTRVLTGVKLLGYGLWKCLYPAQLYSLYGPGVFDFAESPADPGFLLALAVLAGWLVAALWLAKRLPLLFLSMAAFLGFSFLTSNIPLTIGTIFGERLYYMPSLGVCLLPLLLPRSKLVLTLLTCWCLGSCVVVVMRTPAFADSETLFIGDANRLPESADLQAKAGYMYWTVRNDPDSALRYFQRCVDVDPEFAGTWASMARIHERKGDLDRAAELYLRALHTKYVAFSGAENRTIEDYLMVRLRQGKLDEAVRFARETLQRRPDQVFARVVLVDHGAARLPDAERRRLIDEGLRLHERDPYMNLMQAMQAYDTMQRSQEVDQRLAAQLAWALQNANPKLLTASTRIRAHLYLGDVFRSVGDRQRALAVFESLLKDPLVTGPLRARVERQVQELRR